MKLRMYLRGLGIGMIVTAIIMTIALGNGTKKMSDAEIMSRARELGMVDESTTLAEAVKSGTDKKTEDNVEVPEKSSEKKEEVKIEEKKEEKQEEKKEETDVKSVENKEEKKEEVKAEEKQDEKKEEVKPVEDKKEKKEEVKTEEKQEEKKEETDAKPVDNKEEKKEEVKPITSTTSITIAGGCSSDTVAKLLEKGGVIDSAAKFDDYLCKNGYDHKISTGKHDIPKGADYETIAKIITSGNR